MKRTPNREDVLERVITQLGHGEQTFPALKRVADAGDRTLAEVLESLQRQGIIDAYFRRGSFPRRRFYRLVSRQRRRLRW